MFRELVTANRSYRRFLESETISRQTLLELIDLADTLHDAARERRAAIRLLPLPHRHEEHHPGDRQEEVGDLRQEEIGEEDGGAAISMYGRNNVNGDIAEYQFYPVGGI